MPYSDIKELPKHVKNYNEIIQRQWLHVFNKVWNNLTTEKIDINEKEQRAFKAANSVLKKRFTSKESMLKNTRNDYFSYLIDSFVGNL